MAYTPSRDSKGDSTPQRRIRSDRTHLLIRARVEADLDMLRVVDAALVVEFDPRADYAFRCVMRRSDFRKFLAGAVDRIDYDGHFKEAAANRSPRADGRYNAMLRCWDAMAHLQPVPPYGGRR